MHIKHTTESEIPSNKWQTTTIPVANPDLQIRPQFGRKNKGGGGGDGPSAPLPWVHTGLIALQEIHLM